MSDTEEKKPREKRPIDVLRERQGGMSKQLQERFKEQNKLRKAFKEALRKGPRSVPQLAHECQLDSGSVLWHLMAMKKYAEIEEAGDEGDYVLYRLKEGE
jgi:hypothetical protein